MERAAVTRRYEGDETGLFSVRRVWYVAES